MAAIDRRTMARCTALPLRWMTIGGGALAIATGAVAQTVGLLPIEQLHQALHLNGSQEAGWQIYRDAAQQPDQTQARRRAASGLFPRIDAPRRMDLVEAEVRQELADIQRQSQALKAFYATLSPDQQHIFDARTLPPSPDSQRPLQE